MQTLVTSTTSPITPPSPPTHDFPWVSSTTLLLGVSDKLTISLHTGQHTMKLLLSSITAKLSRHMKEGDREAPWPPDSHPSFTLWCRWVGLEAASFSVQLRDVCTLALQGWVAGAEVTPSKTAVRTHAVEVGQPWGKGQRQTGRCPSSIESWRSVTCGSSLPSTGKARQHLLLAKRPVLLAGETISSQWPVGVKWNEPPPSEERVCVPWAAGRKL